MKLITARRKGISACIPKIFSGSESHHRDIISTTPLDITRDMITKDCDIFYTVLKEILKKKNDSDNDTDQRIGIATSVLMNLANQELNIYAEKMAIMLVASGE